MKKVQLICILKFCCILYYFSNYAKAEMEHTTHTQSVLNNYEGLKNKDSSHTRTDGNCESCHCSVWINDTRSCVTNPRYPLADRLTRSYSYSFKIKQDICGLRVYFKDVIFSPPELLSGNCGVDSIVFINSKYSTSSLCGNLSNYEVDLPFSSDDIVEVSLNMQSTSYLWQIIFELIPCSAVVDKPLNGEVGNICGTGGNTLDAISVQKNDIFSTHSSSNPYISTEKFAEEKYFTGSEAFKAHNGLKRSISLDHSFEKVIEVPPIPDVPIGKQNWMAGVFLKSESGHLEFVCSASVISKRYILSKASCFQKFGQQLALENLRVIIGANNISSTIESYRQIYLITIAKIHPEHSGLYYADIAIAELDRPIQFNEYIGPVCLPYLGGAYENNVAWTIGWEGVGKKLISSTLRQVEFRTMSNEECNKKFKSLGYNRVICAEGKKGEACYGDTGGPLQIQSQQNRWTVIGTANLLSDKDCLASKFVSVFTQVSLYIPWISVAVAQLKCNNLPDLVFYRGCHRFE